MTKILEAYCSLHWADGKQKVLATDADVALSWDGDEVIFDLCAQHKREIVKMPLAEVIALGQPTRRPSRGKAPGQGHGGGRVQPVGGEADLIRQWVDAEQIMAADINPDDPGPRRLAYKGRSGGQYFPKGLLERWDAEQARRARKEPAA